MAKSFPRKRTLRVKKQRGSFVLKTFQREPAPQLSFELPGEFALTFGLSSNMFAFGTLPLRVRKLLYAGFHPLPLRFSAVAGSPLYFIREQSNDRLRTPPQKIDKECLTYIQRTLIKTVVLRILTFLNNEGFRRLRWNPSECMSLLPRISICCGEKNKKRRKPKSQKIQKANYQTRVTKFQREPAPQRSSE